MSEPIVILHGWSDKSASFVKLAAFLKRHLGTAPTAIDLADCVSMEDDIRYADLVAACRATTLGRPNAYLSSGCSVTWRMPWSRSRRSRLACRMWSQSSKLSSSRWPDSAI